jgi:hypothetical protein
MNERFIQNAIFLYPQILESFLGKQGIKTDALLPLKYEEVLDIGRADLVFRERLKSSLFVVEVQDEPADLDHLSRLRNYTEVIASRYKNFNTFGILFAPRIPRKILIKLAPPIFGVPYEVEQVRQLLEEYEREEEQTLGIDFEVPQLRGFAKLSYLNKFMIFVLEQNKVTLEKIKEFAYKLTKNPSSMKDPSNRSRQWVYFASKFDLIESHVDGTYQLTTLGIEYARYPHPDDVWLMSHVQRRILITSLLTKPFANGVKVGIFALLRTADSMSSSYNLEAQEYHKIFARFCQKELHWSLASRGDAYNWYGAYAEEIGLVEKIPGSYALRLTSVGKRVLSLLEGAFANYRLSRLMLLETSKFLMPS